MATTETTLTLTTPIKTYYEKVLLERLIAEFLHAMWAQKGAIPAGQKHVEMRRYGSLAPATEALVEGVTPDGKNLSATVVTATPAQYGDFVECSDVLSMTAIDPVLEVTAELFGEQSAETLDTLTRDVMFAGTTVQYAGGQVSRGAIAISHKLTSDEVKKAVRTLKKNKAKRINGAYIGLIGPDASYDLQNDSQWKEAKLYAKPEDIEKGEIGMIHGVRFFETANNKVYAGAGTGPIDVHATLIFGANFYGILEWAGMGLEFIVKALGSSGSSDPLNQRQTTGWKVSFVAKILQDLAAVRIEHAVTA